MMEDPVIAHAGMAGCLNSINPCLGHETKRHMRLAIYLPNAARSNSEFVRLASGYDGEQCATRGRLLFCLWP